MEFLIYRNLSGRKYGMLNVEANDMRTRVLYGKYLQYESTSLDYKLNRISSVCVYIITDRQKFYLNLILKR